ncbi:hypothetical protein LTR22_023077 [Elasticomyces elasticus]|nr:hypothetical protein LTR22_023077 [Elasticomyces elasticus]KAK5764901.1 hypothetical protein LTS12_004928 [Elasticomyces elasticus]
MEASEGLSCSQKAIDGDVSEQVVFEGRARMSLPALGFSIPPVLSLQHLDRFPPAARARELKKAADIFACSGRNIFVHYVAPILETRRKKLLTSVVTKKKYTKTAAQLWYSLEQDDSDEYFYWNEMVGRRIRESLRSCELSYEMCLEHAGVPEDRATCIWHAELAATDDVKTDDTGLLISENITFDTIKLQTLSIEVSEKSLPRAINFTASQQTDYTSLKLLDKLPDPSDITTISTLSISGNDGPLSLASDGTTPQRTHESTMEVLDTLPDRFECEPRMLYSHFARYDFDAVRRAEGKHQTAMLRQLADLFDKTGMRLFYYYMVPRLCMRYSPPRDGSTVTGKAADVWRFLKGLEKAPWCSANQMVKTQLGDGDVLGLEMLQLDSLEPEVLKLHDMAMEALAGHEVRYFFDTAKQQQNHTQNVSEQAEGAGHPDRFSTLRAKKQEWQGNGTLTTVLKLKSHPDFDCALQFEADYYFRPDDTADEPTKRSTRNSKQTGKTEIKKAERASRVTKSTKEPVTKRKVAAKPTGKGKLMGGAIGYIIDRTIVDDNDKKLWLTELIEFVPEPVGEDLPEIAAMMQKLFDPEGGVSKELKAHATELKGDDRIAHLDTFQVQKGSGLGNTAMSSLHDLLTRLPGGYAFSGTIVLSPATPEKLSKQLEEEGTSVYKQESILVTIYEQKGYTVWLRGAEDEDGSMTVMGTTIAFTEEE